MRTNGVGHMAVASVFFFLMSLMVKLCQGLPISQIVFFRGVVAMVICLVQLKVVGISPWGNHWRYLFLRGFFGTCALILFFTTLHKIPMATAVTIQYMSPIFTALLTTLILGETFFKGQFFFFLMAFAGVVTIKGLSGGELEPILIGLTAAFFAACAYTTIRKIQKLGGEHPLVIIFYFPLVTIPLITPLMLKEWVGPSGMQWLYLLGVGVFVQIAQYFMTRAYQLGEGSVVSIAGYLGVIWAAIGGYLFFDELVSSQTMLGILLVLGGVVGNTFYRLKLEKTKPIKN
jgi:drug/metabolite transporter (DMT)-like permease